MGRMISSFQMVSYKVDKLELEAKDSLATLQQVDLPVDKWFFKIAIRKPLYIPDEKMYVGGLDVRFINGEQSDPDVSLSAGIAGLFKVVGDDLSPDIEIKVAKIQIPSILASYLRAAITNILASSGYGTVILPLLNMNALAEQQLKDVEIIRIENLENNIE